MLGDVDTHAGDDFAIVVLYVAEAVLVLIVVILVKVVGVLWNLLVFRKVQPLAGTVVEHNGILDEVDCRRVHAVKVHIVIIEADISAEGGGVHAKNALVRQQHGRNCAVVLALFHIQRRRDFDAVRRDFPGVLVAVFQGRAAGLGHSRKHLLRSGKCILASVPCRKHNDVRLGNAGLRRKGRAALSRELASQGDGEPLANRLKAILLSAHVHQSGLQNHNGPRNALLLLHEEDVFGAAHDDGLRRQQAPVILEGVGHLVVEHLGRLHPGAELPFLGVRRRRIGVPVHQDVLRILRIAVGKCNILRVKHRPKRSGIGPARIVIFTNLGFGILADPVHFLGRHRSRGRDIVPGLLALLEPYRHAERNQHQKRTKRHHHPKTTVNAQLPVLLRQLISLLLEGAQRQFAGGRHAVGLIDVVAPLVRFLLSFFLVNHISGPP